jgi:pimeloyl-ACP methyl ester carboxylesterase
MTSAHDLAPAFLIGGAGPLATREFAKLIEALGDQQQYRRQDERLVVPVDLIAFHGGALPADFSLANEVDTLLAAVDGAGARRAHLFGYSGGGAVALAFGARHADRVASLALEETAWVGNDNVPDLEREAWASLADALKLPAYEALLAFQQLMVAPGAPALPELPPDAPWLKPMVAGIVALSGSFRAATMDLAALRATGIPIYCAVGSLSHPVFELRSRRLQAAIPAATVEVYEGLHHLAPPHRYDAERLAARLGELWAGADA